MSGSCRSRVIPSPLLEIEPGELNELPATSAGAIFHVSFDAPPRVALYLFADGSWVIENFNDQPVSVILNGKALEIGARGWKYDWKL